MTACAFSSRIAAFHDGELPRPLMQEMYRHLAGCASCRTELSQLQGISKMLVNASVACDSSDLTPAELSRFHAAIDAEPEPAVFSLAGPLALIAASVLVICGVWVMALPNPNRPATASGTTAPMAEWERLAMTLHPEPHTIMPSSVVAQVSGDDSRVADWMVESLKGEK